MNSQKILERCDVSLATDRLLLVINLDHDFCFTRILPFRPNVTSLTNLFRGSDMPTRLGRTFGQIPFLPPSVTHMGTSGN